MDDCHADPGKNNDETDSTDDDDNESSYDFENDPEKNKYVHNSGVKF